MNEHIFFAAFAALSFLVGVGCLVRALYLFKTGKRAKRVLSSIQIFTIGVFFFGAVDFYSNMLYQ